MNTLANYRGTAESILPPRTPFSDSPSFEVIPEVPRDFNALGIPPATLEQLVFKFLYFRGDMVGRDLSNAMGLSFSLIDEQLETMKRQHHVGVKKSLGIGNTSSVFALTESGRAIAREYMENNQYTGRAPVPLDQYTEMVRRQKFKDNWLSPQSLRQAYKHLVVEEDILSQIGPAVNASKSFLVYGQPGNGKTALAEALFRLESSPIYMPYSIDCQGNIIQIYDPVYHQKIDDEETSISALNTELPYDKRWFKCKRPFIITGGELTLDMLDLSFNRHSKVYDAPFQLKANNGIYLIDDFGRQKCSPAEILNRWIVPMERHVDYLSFQAGGKMTVPFEAFLIFSTNLRPEQLGDEAFLRRIQYKMFMRSPREPEFQLIFQRFAESRQLECSPELVRGFVDRHYKASDKPLRRCHPRDVITHAIDIINFESLPLRLTDDVLDRAFRSCFVEQHDMDA